MKKIKILAISAILALFFAANVQADMPPKCAKLKAAFETCNAKRGIEKKKCMRQTRRANKADFRTCRKHMKRGKKRRRAKR